MFCNISRRYTWQCIIHQWWTAAHSCAYICSRSCCTGLDPSASLAVKFTYLSIPDRFRQWIAVTFVFVYWWFSIVVMMMMVMMMMMMMMMMITCMYHVCSPCILFFFVFMAVMSVMHWPFCPVFSSCCYQQMSCILLCANKHGWMIVMVMVVVLKVALFWHPHAYETKTGDIPP